MSNTRKLHDEVSYVKNRIKEVTAQLNSLKHLDYVTCTHEIGINTWDGKAETLLVNTPVDNVRDALNTTLTELGKTLDSNIASWLGWADGK